MRIRLYPPTGQTIPFVNVDGQTVQAQGDGSFSLEAKYVIPYINTGWCIAPDDVLASTMAAVGIAGIVPGFSFFETSLNKPVWRNAANSAWNDATGTAVG